MNIPINIYLNIIIISFFLVLGIGVFIYFNTEAQNDKMKLVFLVWYIIIFEINLIYLYYTLNFYNKYNNIKGEKGPHGDMGPRGYKGENQLCISCGDAGAKKDDIYSGNINDKGQILNDEMIKGGKCVFPFVHNHQYEYSKCIKGKTPLNTEDANIYGWCPTELNKFNEPSKFGFCNENENIRDSLNKNKKLLDSRRKYMENNYGILDIDIVSGKNEKEAKEQCDNKGSTWKLDEQDLNYGTDGSFIYMCYKKGIGNNGIQDIGVHDNNKLNCNTHEEKTVCESNGICNWDGNACNNNKYKIVGNGINLNENSLGSPLYLFKKYSNSKFIKDIKFLNESELNEDTYSKIEPDDVEKDKNIYCSTYDPNFYQIHDNLNKNEISDDNQIRFCASKIHNIVAIDTAFRYKDGSLYIFRGNKFWKMSKLPIQNTIKVLDGYPKKIEQRWIKNKMKKNDTDCSIYNNKKDKCLQLDNCFYDGTDKKGTCETKITYNAIFTYGYNNKTYFFKGGQVYLYDDKNMKIASGFPKKINSVFKGIPDNIDAAFTWGKDGKTYFFKGPLYYKYNDKNNKVESGYPKKSNQRWIGMPKLIDAIFTLDNNLENNGDNHPTYVISGDNSYYIDPITDKLKQEYNKLVDKRFLGLGISENLNA